MTTASRFESVGWGFFGAALVLSQGPSVYVVYQITNDATPTSMRLGAAFFLAGFFAAVLSWIANSLLGYIADRRHAKLASAVKNKKRSNSDA